MKREEQFLKTMSEAEYNQNLLNKHRDKIKSFILSAPDKTLLAAVMALIVIGFMAIFSSTAPKCLSDGVSPFLFLQKQLGAFVVGFFLMMFFTNFSYKKLEKYNMPAAVILIILLFLVKFSSLGVSVNGATRWLNLGVQIQPSEFAKPILVMLLASVFKDNASILKPENWQKAFIPIIIIVFLIFLQPNLSMVLLLFITAFVMYVCAGGALFVIFSFLSAVVAGLFLLITKIAMATMISGAAGVKTYQLGRIKTWLNPELDPLGKGYNIIQSLIAFASGGFMGLGYGASVQKRAYLPECHTDFIFAVMAEEWGFIGCLFVIVLFLTILYRGILIAIQSQDMYGKLLAVGLTFSICIQAIINMSVTSSLVPATGVPMPFISFGGSSLVTSMIMIGILLNISKKRITKIGE